MPTIKKHYEGKLGFISFPSSMNTRELLTTTLHNEGKLTFLTTLHIEKNIVHASFPSRTSISTFPSNALHHEGNLFPIIFHFSKRTNALLTTILNHERKLALVGFPSNKSILRKKITL